MIAHHVVIIIIIIQISNIRKTYCCLCHIVDVLMYVLEKWVSIRTVSGNPQYLEECRRGARFFKNILQQLGAKSQLVCK
jgi:hypothetical protein